MFDKYVTQHHQHEHRVTERVVEKRAPTDESVSLLREMESAARKQVLATLRLDNNEFKCVIHVCRDELNAQNIARVSYLLNGKTIQFEYPFRPERMNMEDLIGKLTEKLGEQIALLCLQVGFMEAAKNGELGPRRPL